MELYDAMLKRKSIRKYADKKVDKKVLEELQNYITELIPLYDKISVKTIILESNKLDKYFENSCQIHAPYYIVFTSQEKNWFGENIGFIGEKLIVFLTSLGIGTCWIGTLKPSKTAFELPYVISIAFGYADGELYREGLEQISRKSIEQICLKNSRDDFMNELLQAVRIAPSGINRQPWRIETATDLIHIYCEKPSFLTPVNSDNLKGLMPGVILKKMQGVSCGAAIAHIDMCASYFDKEITFSRLQDKENVHKKLTYLLSAIIKKK